MAGLSKTKFSPKGIQYLDFLQMGVLVVDKQLRVVYWNRWLENHSNIMSETVQGLEFSVAFPDLINSRLSDVIQQALEEQLSAVISAPLNKSLFPLYPSINHQLKQMDLMRQMVQVSSIEDDEGNSYALLQITDMTHAIAKEDQLRTQTQAIQNLVSLDELTAIANRKKFEQRLDDEFKRAQRASTSLVIALVDIDHFKSYNDQYGETQGNECIMKVANALVGALSRSSDLVARYSGQVFGVVMPSTTFEGSVSLAEEMRNVVNQQAIEHEASTTSSFVTVSVGLAHVQPCLSDNLESLLEAAQFSLSQAKQLGGNKAMIYLMQDGSLHACDSGGNNRMLIEA